MTFKFPFFFPLQLSTIYASHITVINAPSPDGSEPSELKVHLCTRQYYLVF